MKKSNFALNFEKAQYYTLQEASAYLNSKYELSNINPKKLIKHMADYDTSTYIHIWFRDERFKLVGDFDSRIMEDPKFREFYAQSDSSEEEGAYWINEFEKVEDKANSDLYSYFSLGLVLSKIDNSTLFNLSFKNEQSEVQVLGFDGILSRGDLEADPTELSFIEREREGFYATGITRFDIGIENIDDVDLEDIKKYISLKFDDIFKTSGGLAYPIFKICMDDLIIIHKDLQALEEQILENAPIPKKKTIDVDQNTLLSRQGVSSEKIIAQFIAKRIAIREWAKDEDEKIRMLDMMNIVWSELDSLGFREDTPELKTLRLWIKGVAPDYASKAGRPPENNVKKITKK